MDHTLRDRSVVTIDRKGLPGPRFIRCISDVALVPVVQQIAPLYEVVGRRFEVSDDGENWRAETFEEIEKLPRPVSP